MASRYYASLNTFGGFEIVDGASAVSRVLILVWEQALEVRVSRWRGYDHAPQVGRCRHFDVERQGKVHDYAVQQDSSMVVLEGFGLPRVRSIREQSRQRATPLCSPRPWAVLARLQEWGLEGVHE